MNEYGKFWLGTWSVLGVVFLGSIFLSTSYWNNHNTKIVHLIESGVSPVAAMCALQDDYGNHPTCIILATLEVKE
jgi:hypothetical protein